MSSLGRHSLLATVTFLTFELGVDFVLVECGGTEVDESQPAGVELNEQVLVLEVAVHHATVVHVERHLNHLPQEVARRRLGQRSSLCDVVEQVDGVVGPFQHQHEAVWPVVVVEQRDDACDVSDFQQQRHLLRNQLTVDLKPTITIYIIQLQFALNQIEVANNVTF